jgi:hypothetical protein
MLNPIYIILITFNLTVFKEITKTHYNCGSVQFLMFFQVKFIIFKVSLIGLY